MPCTSPAAGYSPQIRSRRPNRVRHNSHTVNGTNTRAPIVTQGARVTNPLARSARSETRNQSFLPIHPNRSGDVQPPILPPARIGRVALPTPGTRGDWVIDHPGISTIDDRNRVRPGARMLMATPEMMWSTPKLTVATAWSRPPRAPPTRAATIPHHGPNLSAPQAP